MCVCVCVCKQRSQKALTELKRQIEAKTPPLSTAGKFGVRTVTLLFIKFAKTLHKSGVDKDFLNEMLDLLDIVVRDLKPLSLCDGPKFSPDIAVGLGPMFDYFSSLANKTSKHFSPHLQHKAVEILFRLAIARGSITEILG